MAETRDLGIPGLADAVEIGRGGFAIVYKAFQPAFERFVAVKVFNDLLLDGATSGLFQRECRAIGRISGRSNILTVHDAGTSESGNPYLVMAYIARGSLEGHLQRNGPLPWRDACEIGAKLARALQVAHDSDVLHRDVKPDNVLMSDDTEPLLADFGIARLMDITSNSRSRLSFTPAHVAPEVVAGESSTAAVDIYALGSTMFELLCGRPAFVESPEDSLFLIMRRVEQSPVPDTLWSRDVPEAVRGSILASMAKNPSDRPVSAAAFGTELATALRQDGLPRIVQNHGVGGVPVRHWLGPPKALLSEGEMSVGKSDRPFALNVEEVTHPSPPVQVVAGQSESKTFEVTPESGTFRSRRSRPSGRLLILTLGGCLLAMSIAIGTFVGVRDHGSSPKGGSPQRTLPPTEQGSLAIQTYLSHPVGLAFANDGSFYIAEFGDQGNDRIRRVSLPSGFMTTVAGGAQEGFSGDGGPATAGRLAGPASVAVGTDGSIYIADESNNRVRRVSATGIISSVAGNGQGGFSGDNGPATAARLAGPAGVAIASNGVLFIADNGNNRVRQVSPDGVITTVAGDGRPGFSGDNGPGISASLHGPASLAIGGDGSLYIADVINDRIRRLNSSGVITTVAGDGQFGYGGDNGPAIAAKLGDPTGIAIANDGTLYIADDGNSRVRRISPLGIITTVAGNGRFGRSGDGAPATSGSLNGPSGLAIAADGSLYIADTVNDLVRRVDSSGIMTTVAGK